MLFFSCGQCKVQISQLLDTGKPKSLTTFPQFRNDFNEETAPKHKTLTLISLSGFPHVTVQTIRHLKGSEKERDNVVFIERQQMNKNYCRTDSIVHCVAYSRCAHSSTWSVRQTKLTISEKKNLLSRHITSVEKNVGLEEL